MISFNKDSIFNLKPIELDEVKEQVNGLLIEDEEIVSAFKTIRDQLVFTNKRVIAVDVQGITGIRKSYTSLPYSRIDFFSIQTHGFLEIVPDGELFISFTNGYTATFEFRGNVDIGKIGRMISKYALVK